MLTYRLFPFILLVLTACTTGPTFYSESYLADIGKQQFAQLKQEIPVSKDPQLNAQLRRVATPIAELVSPRLPDAEWEFVVFDNDSLNAFAMPGGKIGVYTGLLNLVESDDELGAVIGHEVAHVLLEHSNQRMSAETLRGIGGIVAIFGTKDMKESDRNKILAAYGIGTQVGLILPYSRSHESEADREGLILSARAGFDPRAAITFWEKMAEAGGTQPPEFLSTHPSHGTRIQDLQAAMPQALSIYQASQARN